jgi:site-specific recombinase XerD
MATITLSLSEKFDTLNRSEILMRFSVSQTQRYRIKSGLFVSVNRWTKKNEVSIPKIETEERTLLIALNTKLSELKKHVLSECEKTDKKIISKEWLETCVDTFHFPEKYKVVAVEPTFFETFSEFIDNRKLSVGRLRSIKVSFRSLQRYELYKQKENPAYTLKLKEVDEKVLSDIDKFFRIEDEIYKKFPDIWVTVKESRLPSPRGQNTINDMFVKIRTFFLWCVENEKISVSPFKKYAIEESVYGTPYYIDIKERNQLYAKNMAKLPKLAVQRDIFVLHCLIGCRVGDYYKMKKSSIINGAIEYIARKTKEGSLITVRVPLNSIALEIIDRYRDDERESLMPFISEQKYNLAIKEMFTFAKLTRMVTVVNPTTREEEKQPLNLIASSHLARRCFVGNLYKQVKDQNLVGSLTGHKEGNKSFARYREIDEEMKTDLVNLLL